LIQNKNRKMSTNIAGRPGTRTQITDISLIPDNQVKGYICVQGIFKRGKRNTVYAVTTWQDVLQAVGSFHLDDDTTLMCKNTVDNGGKLILSRLFHATNPDDITTIDGEISTASLPANAVNEVLASANFNIATWNAAIAAIAPTGKARFTIGSVTTGDTVTVTVNGVAYTYVVGAGNNAAQIQAGLQTALAANSQGFTSVNASAGANAEFDLTGPVGTSWNGFTIVTSKTGTTFTLTSDVNFANGADAVPATSLSLLALVNGAMTNILTYTGAATPTLAATAIAAALNAGSTGYTASNAATAFTVNQLVGSGASANNTPIAAIISHGSFTTSSVKFTGGVTAYAAITSVINAEEVGDGYDGTTVSFVAQANNPDLVTITVTLKDAPYPQVVQNVPRTLGTVNALNSLNGQLQGVIISGLNVSYQLPTGSVTLSGGAQDITEIVDADAAGSPIAKTGWYNFDQVTRTMRLWNFNWPSAYVDAALALYCSTRGDMTAVGRFPAGLGAAGIQAYRQGTSPYNNAPLDSFYFSYWETDAEITDPNNTSNTAYPISGMGFKAAARCKADNAQGEWWSDSEATFAQLLGINKVPFNLASPGNSGAWDILYEMGVNAIVNDPALGICNMGNRSALLDTTRLTSKTNIADLCVFISREVKKIARKMNFNPNDIQMFEQLYLNVLPFIKNTLISGRAIEGDTSTSAGEGVWWFWLGDQLAKNLQSLKVNLAADVDAGKYKARFAFKPKASNEYILLDIAPADTATILSISQSPTLQTNF
jgi:hypothetical protein